MIYIVWALKVILNIGLKYAVAWPLTPLVVLFANKDGQLPNWLYWFTTPDNPTLEDFGWITESRPYLRESNGYQRYINRCFWLWRNSLYGFNESVLSLDTSYGRIYRVQTGDGKTSNLPYGHSGTVKYKLYRDGILIGFQWYHVRQLKCFPKKCIRINLGYKLWGDEASFKCHTAFSCWINKFKADK